MGKFNKKITNLEKKLRKLQKEFNPSARNPYLNADKIEKELEKKLKELSVTLDALTAAMMAEQKSSKENGKDNKEDEEG